MKLNRLSVWLAVACVSAGIGFEMSSFSRADAPSKPAERADSAAVNDRPGLIPGRAILMVSSVPRIPSPPGLPAPDDIGTEKTTPQTHAAILRLARREIFFQALQDPDSGIKKTAWFKELQGDKRPNAVIDAFDKATTVVTLPDTSLVVVTVSIQPPADAATVANAFCSAYIQGRKDRQYGRVAKVIELLNKERNLLDQELEENILKRLVGDEIKLSDAGVGPLPSMHDQRDMVQALDRAIVQTMLERAEASADVSAEKVGPATTEPASADAARRRAVVAGCRLVALRDYLATFHKASADADRLMDEYGVLKRRESDVRHHLEMIDDRLSSMRQFALNSPWADIEFAAKASPN